MKIKDMKLNEVAMNPSVFAQAIEEGEGKGVLVGYEFEVCVPENTIKSAANERDLNQIVPKLIAGSETFRAKMVNCFSLRSTGESKIFNEIFTPKQEAMRTTVEAATKVVQAKVKEAVDPILKQIPAAELAKVLKGWYGRKSEVLSSEEKVNVFFLKGLGYNLEVNSAKLSVRTLGKQLRRAAESINPGALILKKVFGKSPKAITADMRKYFDFDAITVADNYFQSELDDSGNGNYDYDYEGAARTLRPALEQAFGVNVVKFDDYHEKKKNLTDWYIEPDASVRPKDGDGAAEVVTPPMRAVRAIESLRGFYSIARQLNLYTNDSTGLHINVSIPEKFDLLKLIVFMGDTYVLKEFNRENNEYAESVIASLQGTDADSIFTHKKDRTKLEIKYLMQLAKRHTSDHMASASYNGKYISFRHAGGNYLADYEKIANTVGRFIRAMVIAADPNIYREEYLGKLVKVFKKQQQSIRLDARTSDLEQYKALLTNMRDHGVPVIHAYVQQLSRLVGSAQMVRTEIESQARETLRYGYSNAPIRQYNLEGIKTNSQEAKDILVAKFSRDETRAAAAKASLRRFFKVTWSPPVDQSRIMLADYRYILNPVQNNGVNWLEDRGGYVHFAVERVPRTDPIGKKLYVKAIKEYMRQLKAAKDSAKSTPRRRQ